MKDPRSSAPVLIALFVALAAGCGGGGSSRAPAPVQQPALPPVSVSVSPESATVEAGATQQFTATVTNDSSNAGVTWLIQDCFTNPCGVIDGSGKYTAPSSGVLSQYSVTVRATSKASPDRSATAAVRVIPLPSKVTLSPSLVTVAYGRQIRFRTSVNPPAANPTLDWSLNGADCVGEGCGTIDLAGGYTAPASPANPFDVTVTARVSGHPEIFSQATVKVRPENPDLQRLQGTYIFYLSGFDGDGQVTFVGSLTADGQGHITDATLNSLSDWGSFNFPHVTGSYSIFADDRGQLVLDLPWIANGLTFSLRDLKDGVATRGRMAIVDPLSWSFSGTGWFARQEAEALSGDPLSGDYAFRLEGRGSKGSFLAVAGGRFTADPGILSAGQLDLNNGDTDFSHATFSGTITTGPEGRSTVVMPLGSFVVYAISKDEFVLMQSDVVSGGLALAGWGLRQTQVPASLSGMAGPTVLSLSGRDRALLAQMDLDANGALAGTFDTFQGERVLSHVDGAAGSFTLDGDGSGRGTFQRFGETSSYVYYATGPRSGFVVASNGLSGTLEAQASGPFTDGALSGDFTIGVLPTPGMYFYSPFATGTLAADGQGLLAGVIDNHQGGGLGFARSYSISSSGRMVITWEAPDPDPFMEGPSVRVFYLISPEKAVGISHWGNASGPIQEVSAVSLLEKK